MSIAGIERSLAAAAAAHRSYDQPLKLSSQTQQGEVGYTLGIHALGRIAPILALALLDRAEKPTPEWPITVMTACSGYAKSEPLYYIEVHQ